MKLMEKGNWSQYILNIIYNIWNGNLPSNLMYNDIFHGTKSSRIATVATSKWMYYLHFYLWNVCASMQSQMIQIELFINAIFAQNEKKRLNVHRI